MTIRMLPCLRTSTTVPSNSYSVWVNRGREIESSSPEQQILSRFGSKSKPTSPMRAADEQEEPLDQQVESRALVMFR